MTTVAFCAVSADGCGTPNEIILGDEAVPGLTDLAEHAYGLKDLHDAVVLRNHLLTCFEFAARTSDSQRRQALLTFVVVGGGPTGVELAGALEELIHLALTRDSA